MGFFKSKAENELDAIIRRIEVNMSNNYKDNAQEALRDLESMIEALKSEGKLKPKKLAKYESAMEDYKIRLKGYSHKDQKPYWT